MLKIFFRLFATNFIHDKTVAILNTAGLAIGISLSLIMYLWLTEEYSFDKFHENSNRIYRILSIKVNGDGAVKSTLTPAPLGQALKNENPQIRNAAPVLRESIERDFLAGDKRIKVKVEYTNEDFFRMFSFPEIGKTGELYFPNHNSLVITSKCALKLFGSTDCLGKEIIMSFYGDTRYVISAIVEVPHNSHLQFEALAPHNSNPYLARLFDRWDRAETVTYIELEKNATITQTQLRKFINYLEGRVDEPTLLYFQPLESIHLHTDFSDRHSFSNTGIRYVRIIMVGMVLVMILSGLNFIIIATARSEKRRKEIAIKKLFGSEKTRLILHFLAENMIYTLVAFLLAILIVMTVLPYFNVLTNKELSLNFDYRLMAYFLGAMMLTGGIASAYLSLYLSSFRTIDLLSGVRVAHMRQNVSKYITPLQMIISFVFIMFFISIYLQIKYMQDKDKGLDLENIIGVKTQGFIYKYEEIKNELLKNPDILRVTASGKPPVNYNFDKFKVQRTAGGKDLAFALFSADPDYLSTFGITLKEGAFFPESMNMKGYFDGEYRLSSPVVINQTARKMLGNIRVGERFLLGSFNSTATVIGITEDFHFMPLQYQVDPMVMIYHPESFLEFYVRINPQRITETIQYIEAATAPFRGAQYGFDYYFLEDLVKSQYSSEISMLRLGLIIMILSMIISMFGLGGMVYYSVVRQRKQISIRRVFGAGTSAIERMFVKEAGWIFAIAFAISLAFAAWIVQDWLNAYSYRIALPLVAFMLAGLILFTIVTALTLVLVRKENNRNPVENLRYE
ncbi:MAG: ABC transporter permease [Bacteroidetes bacterium]|nr:ABC transporter permease [Bacteroidota bacterium]